MANANTYWEKSRKHQDIMDKMIPLVPAYGECTEGSLLELYRVMQGAYYDMYNNGLGNVEVRVPPLISELAKLRDKGVIAQASTEVQDAVGELTSFYKEYMQAEASAGWMTDEDDGDEYWEDDYPCPAGLKGAFEVLMDFVLELCRDCEDVEAPFQGRAKAA